MSITHACRSKRLAREIGRSSGQAGKGETVTTQRRKLYQKLLKTTRDSVAHARQVIPLLQQYGQSAGQVLAESLTQYLPLMGRIMDQAYRRVVRGQTVPATTKLVSLFEPHTAIIRRGKPAPHETEFGRKVWLDEVDGPRQL